MCCDPHTHTQGIIALLLHHNADLGQPPGVCLRVHAANETPWPLLHTCQHTSREQMQLLQAICAVNEKLAHAANETHAHAALNAPVPEKLTARGGGGGLGWRAGEADNHGTTPLDEAAHITADGRRPDIYLLILKHSGLADLTLVSRRKFATQRQKRQQNSSRSEPPRTRLYQSGSRCSTHTHLH